MQVPGTAYTTYNCFHGAKVSNFYILGKNEITISQNAEIALSFFHTLTISLFLVANEDLSKKVTRLFLPVQCRSSLYHIVANHVLLFA